MNKNMAQSISLNRSTFSKLSPHEFLLANLHPPDDPTTTTTKRPSLRTNGRAPEEPRRLRINTGSSLSHAHGSAIVRNGDTTVICGVRGEVLPVAHIPHYRPGASAHGQGQRDEMQNYDLLVPNIELATGSAPQFLPGVPPTALAQTLSTRVYSLLHACGGLVDVDELRIWGDGRSAAPADGSGEPAEEDGDDDKPQVAAYWTLYIDLLFVSFDGNPFDAAWAAVLAALRNTKLPKAWWDHDRGVVLCSRTERLPLSVRGLPMACSAAVFREKDQGAGGRYWVLLDPDRLEESLCGETVTVVLDRTQGESRIRSLSKNGGVVIGPQLMREIVGLAEKRWDEFRAVMESESDMRMALS